MKTFYLRLFSVLILIILVVSSGAAIATAAPVPAPLAATITYAADKAVVFNNPERGFHNRYEIIDDVSVNDYASSATSIAGFSPDSIDRTFARAKADGDTIIHSYIHLDKYTAVDVLPQALLDNLSSGLAAIRAAGLKIVLRPAYVWSGIPNVPEARIISHIDQLNAVISANADVVLHMEAGYLGQWGEWHDGIYVVDPAIQAASDNRYRIAKEILSTLPDTIPVVIRYPVYIKELMDRVTPPAGGILLTQAEKDRIGFHNDCFLYNANDRGSYDKTTWMGTFTIAEEKQWMYDLITSFGANKMVGGETCDGNGRNDAAGLTVQSDMTALHWSEINLDYWAGAINVWKAANLTASGNDPAETAFVRLQRKMGYRLRLIDATFPTSATAGGNFTFSAHLSNDGYAGIIKPRPIFLVFQNATYRSELQLNSVDVRNWLSGANTLPQQTVTLPANMPAGTYKLALWLPDKDNGLRSRPEYSVRLANYNMWNTAMGYNVLSTVIKISGSGSATASPAPTYTRTLTPTVTPTSTSTPSGYYEAEAGSNTVAGGAVVASCGTCSGSYKVGYVGNNAGTLQYNGVHASTAGSYTLAIYYLNGDTVSRSVTVSVNGAGGVNVNLPVTGGWSTVGSVRTTIRLNKGSGNTIKFSNASSWAPDFDRVTITSNAAPTGGSGTKVLTVHSNQAEDGWILESNETSGIGSRKNSAASTFRLGDEKGNRQYRTILSFDTGPLPNTAIIQSAVLKIKRDEAPVGANPFTVLGSVLADIRRGRFGASALELADFNSPASATAVGAFDSNPVGNWYKLTLDPTGRSNINKAGKTQFRLYFSTDDNDDNIANYMKFLSNQSELIITYIVPNTPTPTLTKTKTPKGTPTKTKTPTITLTPSATSTPIPGSILLDNFDGSPVWSDATLNDLGKWAGANGFANGGTNSPGTESGGALVLDYTNGNGWFGSDVKLDLSSNADLVFVIKGAAGGEEDDFHLTLGGVEKTFADFSGNTITTSYKTIHIDLAANGVNLASPNQLIMTFWFGGHSAITIDEIRFEATTPIATSTPSVTPIGTATPTSTSVPGSVLLDNFDGSPAAWSGSSTNDLGKWTGANSFPLPHDAGLGIGGALVFDYNGQGGWFGSDVQQDLSSNAELVFVIKGAAGGEEDDFHISLGGVDKSFAAFSGDTITTSYKTIHINLAANGVDLASPGQLQMNFNWDHNSGTVTIDEIRFDGTTPLPTPTPSATPAVTATHTSTPIPGSVLLDNFDGSPAAWSGSSTNDLGKWTGANSFPNGAGLGSGGALIFDYNGQGGWFGSDVLQDLFSTGDLVFVIKGAAGGEEDDFHISLGGVDKSFAAFSGDTITTSYKTIHINLAANGVDLASPGQLQMNFNWDHNSGTVTIDEIRFQP